MAAMLDSLCMTMSPDQLTQGQPGHSNQICDCHGVHSMSDLPQGEIKSQPNQLSAHGVIFRIKQLDSVFTLIAEITRLAYHSIIKKKKMKS